MGEDNDSEYLDKQIAIDLGIGMHVYMHLDRLPSLVFHVFLIIWLIIF